MKNPLSRVAFLNAAHLKIIAMALMVCDHAWAVSSGDDRILHLVGRLVFPIFAFQLAEGYAHTRDYKTYFRRMLVFALISEIPFNFMAGGGAIYPFHQNVLFTFCIGLWAMRRMDLALEKGPWRGKLVAAAWAALAWLLGTILFVDYDGRGVLMVLLFFLTRDRSWGWLAQLAGMVYINVFMMKGMSWEVNLLGQSFFFPEQGLAVLSLLPIWLYNGKRGWNHKVFQIACYAFYPVHITILVAIALLT